MFNVTARASNLFTNGSVEDEYSIIVTEKPCEAPRVMIPFNHTNNRAPKQYYRTETVRAGSIATLNCSGVLSTRYKIVKIMQSIKICTISCYHFRKNWEIFSVEVNVETGDDTLTMLNMLEIAPDSYQLPQLSIAPL